jgi:nucleoside-diphosphate-sugar epimerase
VLSRNKVWVIGSDSFTGKYLIPRLMSEGFDVVTTLIDITDRDAINNSMASIRPDYIINLAAISFVPDGVSEKIYAVNTFGVANILDAAMLLDVRPKKIILASTANIYGINEQEEISEDEAPNPLNHYGCSKWSMEQIAKNYSELSIIITRPFNYTGVGQDEKFLIPKIIKHFKNKNKVIQLGNIDVARDFSDVRWVSEAYVELLKGPEVNYEIYNLCSGHPLNINVIISHIVKLTGHKIEVQIDEKFVRKNEIQKQCGSNKKLLSACNKLSSPFAFEETLKWMLEAQ